jgi:hypothetical protein
MSYIEIIRMHPVTVRITGSSQFCRIILTGALKGPDQNIDPLYQDEFIK